MNSKVDKSMSKQELAKKVKILEIKLSVTEQALEREQAKMRELIKFGGALLWFAARAGNAVSYLDNELAALYIADTYLSLTSDLQELNRLDELEDAMRDEKGELMKIVIDEDLECEGSAPVAWVIGRRLGICAFED